MLPLLSLALALVPLSVCAASPYSESLVLKPLPHSLLATFDFSSNASEASIAEKDYRFFPRSLSQILTHAHTKELHIRFSSGRWDDDNWGTRPRDGAREGGTGIEMWAWVEGESKKQSFERWLGLANSLSGLFCASLNYIDSTRSVQPVHAFEPEGSGISQASNIHLWHGALPREVVCTENLTPFMKMLPCKGKSGISSLLDGHKIFDAEWQSMAIDIRRVCQGTDCSLQIQQTIDMVLDLERSTRPAHDPIPRPVPDDALRCDTTKGYHEFGDSCYPLPPSPYPAFDLETVFGRKVKGSCALTDSKDSEPPSIFVEPYLNQQVQVTEGRHLTFSDPLPQSYRVAPEDDFNLHFYGSDADPALRRKSPLLKAERTMTGHGQQRGGLVTVLENFDPNHAVDIVYLEALPWFMKAFVHTLDAKVAPVSWSSAQARHLGQSPVKSTHYQPGIDRERSAHLELLLTIPPASKLTLSYDFEKAVLRYTEYPPDANRGFDVPPAVIRILPSPAQGRPTSLYLRTTSLLLYAASPDFSMPYNVIILTSTVMALGFGSLYNILVRRFVTSDEADAVSKGGLLERLRGRIKALKARFAPKTKSE